MPLKTLLIEKTRQTPFIHFIPEEGLFKIGGRSIPENTFAFYEPVIAWLEDYVKDPAKVTVFEVHLEYFNTSSSKFILELFRKLQQVKNVSGSEFEVIWFYDKDDEEMMETGEDYRDLTGIPFKIVEA
ncbi:MAG TPA: nuclear pore complex subunit [Bacteroidales bacterium]|nr:MAG: hypothetical protein A2X11_12840 [Bacteroidetes bacterium GWE2_42_24]OFY28946.1 MAG: hypothetical protein A2X09_17045 [Bacteroidetes bacterium GWF2_43_11]PKP23730.1 MAG: nuclear pore complex subunit [Bacteroidetes bacterium HGW-Bacteroidetes-22]HBZ65591.1 nuclear pore complex subunit [Bacteroidales bacterium]